jgi:SAM-dependent methyltransferase
VQPDAHAKTNAATALAAFLFLAALAWVSVALAGPPPAVPESAPASEFSSARALKHVRAVARAAHPTGSEEIERVRGYILGELSALGVSAEVQTAEVVPRQAGAGWPVAAARVQNVVARVPGAAGGRALMLAAHYDSVPTGPGASDDGAGVATLLETLRALKSGPPLRNDLILVFTDAEELGLLGARGFADRNPLMKTVALVLNFEARGAGGPSLMFETSEGNGALVGELAEAAPHPIANSLMYAVYRRLPNDTDMTVFKGAGAAGLNFAYADRIASYHTALDNAQELDERSLQHHGSYALALARRFGDLELVDGSEAYCADLRERFAQAQVHCALFEDFEPHGTFDAIVLGHVLEHVADPRALLRRCRAWLADDGLLYAAVPNARSLHRQAAVLMGLLGEEHELNDTDRHHGHRRVYDPESFRADVLGAGLRIRVFGGFWLKPVSNAQIEETWSDAMLEAFFALGERYPDVAAEIYVVADAG